jgi:hypothetical protein
MTTTQAPPLTFVVAPKVLIEGSHYVVLYGDMEHVVGKDRKCNCGSPACPCVSFVEDYLRRGGRRAPDPATPCPVCGGETVRDKSLSTARTQGWSCVKGGRSHYFLARGRLIAEGWKQRKWIFPPAPGYAGIPMCGGPTARQISEESHARWAKDGYNPAA